jgi:uncharacterized protein YrrD
MLFSAKSFFNYSIHATDGEIGKVEQLYFDDENWMIRYFVVNTGGWFSGRRVFISPISIKKVDWVDYKLHVSLSCDQVEKSPEIDTKLPVSQQEDSYLRSSTEVFGYLVQAQDAKFGHVEDFIIDDSNLKIRYLVIDTVNFWPSRSVLISPNWVQSVSWENRIFKIDLSEEKVKAAPVYHRNAPINRDDENRLYDYYGRPKYWDEEDFRSELRKYVI